MSGGLEWRWLHTVERTGKGKKISGMLFSCLPAPLVLVACIAQVEANSLEDSTLGIKPYAQNPYYWEYQGEPVLLVGGSKEDNLFQIPDLDEHLDLLANVGGNYVRSTMSSRDPGNVQPFYQRANGKYDLNHLNDVYFERFEKLLQFAAERDIIVQIELWDRFDYARDHWLKNPFRPANNVNYKPEQSGLANEYPRHPAKNEDPFFRSIPAHDDNKILLKYQHALADRILEIALKYPNVLYTMDNETSATPEWGAYWSNYIKRKAARAGVKVFTTEMWDASDLTHEQHRRTLDYPELYGFVDISQNNHNTGQKHWDNLRWVHRYIGRRPRPLNQVKIYGAETGRYGSERDAIERFWRGILGGSAALRFHRPRSGIGLNGTARANIHSARMLLAEFDIFRSTSDAASRLLADRRANKAYLAYVAGEQYTLYFPDGGSVRLDLRNESSVFQVKWLDVLRSQWREAPAVQGGGLVAIDAPGPGHWVVLVSRQQKKKSAYRTETE